MTWVQSLRRKTAHAVRMFRAIWKINGAWATIAEIRERLIIMAATLDTLDASVTSLQKTLDAITASNPNAAPDQAKLDSLQVKIDAAGTTATALAATLGVTVPTDAPPVDAPPAQ